MAINIDYDKLSLFHGFSKTPVSSKISLGNAINKAGHVVSSSDVWADEIPYFGKFGTTQVAHDTVSKDTTYGDMLFIGGNSYYKRNDVEYAEGKTFNDLWTNVTSDFKDGYVFENRHGKGVIVYHENQYLQNLNDDNNANTNSENCAARLWVFESPKDENGQVIEGAKKVPRLVEQFVGPTDRALNGLASVSYAPIVTPIGSDGKPGEAYKEGEQYSLVAFSGTILWSVDKANAVTTQSDGSIKSKFQISCFEYIGETLDKKIESISTTAKGGVSALSDSAKNAGFSITNPEGEPPTLNIATATITDGIFASTTGNKAKLVTAADVENYVAKNAKVSVNGTSATKLTVNGTATNSNDLVKVVVTKDTTDGVALNLSATVDVANVNAGVFSSADANKLVTAIDAEEIATNVIDKSINSTDANTIGGKIKDIKDTVDDIENALSGVAQVVNDLELSTTQAISDAITDSKNYTDSEIDKVEKSISDALEAHSEDIAKVEAAIEGLTTTGLTREVLANGQTTASITNPQANVIYLVKDSTSETGDYVEYLYVNGKFEAIGTTSTDLSEYVKSVKINGSAYPANNTNKGALDLGTVVIGLYNSLPSGVTGVGNTLPNNSSVYAGIASGRMEIGVADASTTGKGLVKLAANVADGSTTDVTTAKAVKDYADTKVGDVEYFGENDLISSKAEIVDGVLKITEKEVTWASRQTGNNNYWNLDITKVVNNEAFIGDEKYATVETNNLKDGSGMFYTSNLSEFSSDLSSLEDGSFMFWGANKLETFVCDMPHLTTGFMMFGNTKNAGPQGTDVTGLKTFIGDLSSLETATQMFCGCTYLETFIGDLSSLKLANEMFNYTKLSVDSVSCIADTVAYCPKDSEGTYRHLAVSWSQLTSDTEERQELVGELSRIVDKEWTVVTNKELLPLFDSEIYKTGQTEVQLLDLDSEPQTIYYVVKK